MILANGMLISGNTQMKIDCRPFECVEGEFNK